MESAQQRLQVRSIAIEAQGVRSFILEPIKGAAILPYTAGAHIDVHLPGAITRSYSVVNPPGDGNRYVIAVSLEANSRGGSRHMHEQVRAGDILLCSAPRNNFALVEDAPHVVLIAGGIGITPLWCMAQRLEALGRSWELFYTARMRSMAAFVITLTAVPDGRVHLNFDQEPGGRMLDLDAIVARTPLGAHLYCCGPATMLESFARAASDRPRERIHIEYFGAKPLNSSQRRDFTVELEKSGRSFAVPPDKGILEVLLDAGLEVPHSCTEGTCGACETAVIRGVPEHHDSYLRPDERAKNRTMMICVSRCVGERLVLDL